MSVCIVMVPVAAFCGRNAATGRKRLMIVCFAILPLWGFLLTLSTAPLYVTAVQVLDGISAGIFGVVSLLVIADFTKGSGHFNFVNGILITTTGLGASISNVVAGYVVHSFSYKTAFLFLNGVAGAALLLYIFLVKETADKPVVVT